MTKLLTADKKLLSLAFASLTDVATVATVGKELGFFQSDFVPIEFNYMEMVDLVKGRFFSRFLMYLSYYILNDWKTGFRSGLDLLNQLKSCVLRHGIDVKEIKMLSFQFKGVLLIGHILEL